MGEKRSAYRLLVGKPEGKRPLGKENLESSCEFGIELSDSMKCRETIEWPSI
jgi:hypothetical protein